ncbi:hypothetical protein BJ912DRAFT_646730 [Pholiota molesta]|nr:hypothetical protein BJ912DRAFT_646730 [Pholiota molesta]
MCYKPTASLTCPLPSELSKFTPKMGPPTSASAVLSAAHPGSQTDAESLTIIIKVRPTTSSTTSTFSFTLACTHSSRQVNILASPSPSSPPQTARLSIRVAAPDATDNERCLHLSFAADSELYDWQDDIYSRAPQLGGASSSPFGFVPKPTSARTSSEISETPVYSLYMPRSSGAGRSPQLQLPRRPRLRYR